LAHEPSGDHELALDDALDAFLQRRRSAGLPDDPRWLPPIEDAERILRELEEADTKHGGHRIVDEIGRGGMGVVYRVWDVKLERHLAMKVVQDRHAARAHAESGMLRRFLDEARVTGQLEHPGIVPVHELGVDEEGRAYFTMPLVQGRDLGAILRLVREGREGWTPARALGVLLHVCETMSYAHAKGVVHRDLKPTNVMVGPFGEVYVLDWGLAKAPGRATRRDPRLELEEPETRDGRPPDAPVLTLDGAVVGTPCYMPPEQAAGRAEELGPRSDVYAVGAMLYELLAGHRPYVPADTRTTPRVILAALAAGPPAPLPDEAPAALRAICEKAMQRSPSDRYRDMQELAEDLRAYQENRIVRAYRTGWLERATRWVGRNRLLAASLLVLAMSLFVGGVGSAIINARKNQELLREQEKTIHALADYHLIDVLEGRRDALTARFPLNRASYAGWVREVNELLERRSSYGFIRPRTEELQEILDDWLLVLNDFAEQIAGDANPESPFLVEDWMPSPRADEVVELSALDEERRGQWQDALRAIEGDPRYDGLRLVPRAALQPLGRDPDTGLVELAHLPSGDAPRRDDGGRLVLTEASAIVFVLLPGGEVAGHASPIPAFLLAKHELTQGQWARLTGMRPSALEAGDLHPVENVTTTNCEGVLGAYGLRLPEEDEWEHAARAGTSTPWWTGAERESLEGKVNLADETFLLGAGDEQVPMQEYPALRDGVRWHAPVDTMPANPFGLHHVLGNVAELCVSIDDVEAVARGGSYASGSLDVRATSRLELEDGVHDRRATVGVRPALDVETW